MSPARSQESIGRDAQRCVMVEAAPASPFEVAEPNLLFEFLIIAFDTAAQFGGTDKLMERDVRRKR